MSTGTQEISTDTSSRRAFIQMKSIFWLEEGDVVTIKNIFWANLYSWYSINREKSMFTNTCCYQVVVERIHCEVKERRWILQDWNTCVGKPFRLRKLEVNDSNQKSKGLYKRCWFMQRINNLHENQTLVTLDSTSKVQLDQNTQMRHLKRM